MTSGRGIVSGSDLSRRDFLQIVGLGGTATALGGCGNTSIESGAELVESYVVPENFVVPGVGVYYASTCTQCASACGIMGRVREGRVLKLEGSSEAATSGGKICGLGQAAVQQHWSPDRFTTPMIRENGVLMPATWDKAMVLLSATRAPGDRTGRRAWLTGPTSGHQQILLRSLIEAGAATDYLVYDALSTAVGASVNRKLFGVDELASNLPLANLYRHLSLASRHPRSISAVTHGDNGPSGVRSPEKSIEYERGRFLGLALYGAKGPNASDAPLAIRGSARHRITCDPSGRSVVRRICRLQMVV
jgi:hypothetical protein